MAMRIAVGLDIGGTNIKAVIVSEDGKKVFGNKYPTPSVSEDDDLSIEEKLIGVLRGFLEESRQQGIDISDITAIGLGVAGIIDTKKGVVIESPNISAIDGMPIRDVFQGAFSMPVVLDNDANAYAYGERWNGAGREIDNFIVITLGTGLGGGLIYKGEIYMGALEIGHMVVEPNGRFCPCGSWGCLESYASGRAVVDRATSSLEKGTHSMLAECCGGNFYKLTPADVYKMALEGDSLSREVFKEAGQYLGIGVANLINLLSPDAVIIGGGLVGAWDLFIEELKKEVSKRAFKHLSAGTRILKSGLQDDGGAIGAAGLALRASS
jgi:glucokinase